MVHCSLMKEAIMFSFFSFGSCSSDLGEVYSVFSGPFLSLWIVYPLKLLSSGSFNNFYPKKGFNRKKTVFKFFSLLFLFSNDLCG